MLRQRVLCSDGPAKVATVGDKSAAACGAIVGEALFEELPPEVTSKCPMLQLRPEVPATVGKQLTIYKSAIKQRGREKKGPPDIIPKSFSQKVVLCSSHRSHREICTPNRATF